MEKTREPAWDADDWLLVRADDQWLVGRGAPKEGEGGRIDLSDVFMLLAFNLPMANPAGGIVITDHFQASPFLFMTEPPSLVARCSMILEVKLLAPDDRRNLLRLLKSVYTVMVQRRSNLVLSTALPKVKHSLAAPCDGSHSGPIL